MGCAGLITGSSNFFAHLAIAIREAICVREEQTRADDAKGKMAVAKPKQSAFYAEYEHSVEGKLDKLKQDVGRLVHMQEHLQEGESVLKMKRSGSEPPRRAPMGLPKFLEGMPKGTGPQGPMPEDTGPRAPWRDQDKEDFRAFCIQLDEKNVQRIEKAKMVENDIGAQEVTGPNAKPVDAQVGDQKPESCSDEPGQETTAKLDESRTAHIADPAEDTGREQVGKLPWARQTADSSVQTQESGLQEAAEMPVHEDDTSESFTILAASGTGTPPAVARVERPLTV